MTSATSRVLNSSAGLGLVLALVLGLRSIGWIVDPLHRWWLPVSLQQGSAYLYTGELMIAVVLFAAVGLGRRMIAANEWEDVFVLSLAVAVHAQLLLPWGRWGALHALCAFSAFAAYAWLLLQTGYRHQSRHLLAWGGGMIGLTVGCAVALQQSHFVWFGLLEQTLIIGLLAGFRLYDREQLSAAIQRESSPRTCRYNNFKPPFLLGLCSIGQFVLEPPLVPPRTIAICVPGVSERTQNDTPRDSAGLPDRPQGLTLSLCPTANRGRIVAVTADFSPGAIFFENFEPWHAPDVSRTHAAELLLQ